MSDMRKRGYENKIPVLLAFLILFFSPLAFTTSIEYLNTNDTGLSEYDSIESKIYSLKVGGREFSVGSWWENRPDINPVFIKKTVFENEIINILTDMGLVIDFDSENIASFEIRAMENDLVYVKADYAGRKTDNSSDLFPKDTFINYIRNLLLQIFPSFENNLPKLLLLLTPLNVETVFPPLYRSENAYVFMTDEPEFQLKIDGEAIEIHMDNSPVTMARIADEIYELTIKSKSKRMVTIDGTAYQTPITLKLKEGIHTVVVDSEKRYIYLEKNMEMELEADSESGTAEINVTVPATLTVRDETGNLVCEKYVLNTLSLNLESGSYICSGQPDGFKRQYAEFEVKKDGKTVVDIEFSGLPGTVKLDKELSDQFDGILLNNELIILVKNGLSVLFDKSGNQKTLLDEEIKGCTDNFYYSGHFVRDNHGKLILHSEDSVIHSIESGDSLLIFESGLKLSCYLKTLDFISWERKVDYYPWKFAVSGDYLVILDIMSRVIILNRKTGFSKILDRRIPGVSGVKIAEITTDCIRVQLLGTEEFLEYYSSNGMVRMVKNPDYPPNRERNENDKIELSDGSYFDTRDITERIIDICVTERLIGILTEKHFKILYR